MECTFPYRSRPLFPSRTIDELAEDYDSFFFESWKTAKKQNVVGSVNTSVKNRLNPRATLIQGFISAPIMLRRFILNIRGN